MPGTKFPDTPVEISNIEMVNYLDNFDIDGLTKIGKIEI